LNSVIFYQSQVPDKLTVNQWIKDSKMITRSKSATTNSSINRNHNNVNERVTPTSNKINKRGKQEKSKLTVNESLVYSNQSDSSENSCCMCCDSLRLELEGIKGSIDEIKRMLVTLNSQKLEGTLHSGTVSPIKTTENPSKNIYSLSNISPDLNPRSPIKNSNPLRTQNGFSDSERVSQELTTSNHAPKPSCTARSNKKRKRSKNLHTSYSDTRCERTCTDISHDDNPLEILSYDSDSTIHMQTVESSLKPMLSSVQPADSLPKEFDKKQCIVIHGIRESRAQYANDRLISDLDNFQTCLQTLLRGGESITVLKAFRLGQIDKNPDVAPRSRPMKIVLQTEEQAQLLLKRKQMLRTVMPEVFFQPDYTLLERDKLRKTLQDLKLRREAGEKNLRILNGEIIAEQKSFLWKKPITMQATKLSQLPGID
jgi:hypothetical protein